MGGVTGTDVNVTETFGTGPVVIVAGGVTTVAFSVGELTPPGVAEAGWFSGCRYPRASAP